MRRCAVHGCSDEAVFSLGVRCRRPNTRALWAPNADAGLCDEHARGGLVVSLTLEPMPELGGVLVDVAGTRRFVPYSEAVDE